MSLCALHVCSAQKNALKQLNLNPNPEHIFFLTLIPFCLPHRLQSGLDRSNVATLNTVKDYFALSTILLITDVVKNYVQAAFRPDFDFLCKNHVCAVDGNGDFMSQVNHWPTDNRFKGNLTYKPLCIRY